MNFYMFSSRIKKKVFGNINLIRVVTINIHSTLLNAIVIEHLFHPKKLGTTISCGNIFHLNNGQGY